MKKYLLQGLLIPAVILLISGCGARESAISNASGNSKNSLTRGVAVQETVTIGNQEWMATNLSVDVFRNGDPVPHAESDEEWLQAGENKQPAYCYYNNDPENEKRYGKLYNWYAVNDPRGLAPEGWRVASLDDWNQLIDFLGRDDNPAAKLKTKEGWDDFQGVSGNGTDDYGFSAMPGCFRYDNCLFFVPDRFGIFWTTTEKGPAFAWQLSINFNRTDVSQHYRSKEHGFSVRCLKD